MYKITGRITQINDTEERTPSLKTRTFVLETEEEFAQVLLFQTINHKTALLDRVRVGQEITLWFALKGRAWNDTVIVNLSCYKIEGVELPPLYSTNPHNEIAQDTNVSSGGVRIDPVTGDDLPF